MQEEQVRRQRDRARRAGVNLDQASRLKQLRTERHLSQRQLAHRARVQFSTIQRTETRSFRSQPRNRRALARFFKVPVDVLFTKDGWAR